MNIMIHIMYSNIVDDKVDIRYVSSLLLDIVDIHYISFHL